MHPDRTLSDAAYLSGIAKDRRKSRARIQIRDDPRGDVTSRRTDGFERLLKMSNGLLGQSPDLMVLISTNVRPEELNPTFSRGVARSIMSHNGRVDS